MFNKKKKKAEEVKPEDVPETKPEEQLPEPPKQPKAAKKAESTEPKGKFSLRRDEMDLAVNALASSEEFKVYQQMLIGQQIAEIITSYNKAVEGKSEVPSKDTDEEPLPE